MGNNAMKVIGIGDNVVDDYIHIRTMFPGGNALNFSVYASMLGCDAAYLGVFGSDESAKHVQRTLAETGVDTSHCRCVDGPNGRAILTIEDGERVFISSNEGGISKTVPMEFIFDDLDYLQSFSIVHTSAYSYMDSYLLQMQGLNPLLSYDFSDDFNNEHALSLCQYIDFGFFSCAEWTEEAAMELLEKAVNRGCTIAVATRGPQEVILYDSLSWFRQAPRAVIPTDTLGAGDAFISGFLISYIGGKANTSVHQASLIKNSLGKAASFAAEICQLHGAFGHGLHY
ncbi:PfkB family carbohydrate kinase [uncultured Eudoraea sp.]|uniref:PfkB family carbohydrate kinase n=1 Tax=uncultured Eudoraea sp. TaxID=1035614 RepID=UPI002610BCC2|nr:PfkB family carbohydrate kinase [uncultured Eudoraea sp.]